MLLHLLPRKGLPGKSRALKPVGLLNLPEPLPLLPLLEINPLRGCSVLVPSSSNGVPTISRFGIGNIKSYNYLNSAVKLIFTHSTWGHSRSFFLFRGVGYKYMGGLHHNGNRGCILQSRSGYFHRIYNSCLYQILHSTI